MTHTVLVVDDNADILLIVETVLRRLGLNVVCACDGIEGVRQYQEIEPDLVITDIFMPNQDGIGAIREIRAHNSNAKIIAMSGNSKVGNLDMLQMASKLGAEKLLAKPFEPDELRAAVSSILMIQ
jgi:CheY-like chemotaxis protein